MLVLGAYEGTSALSRVIKWETRSAISHVSIMQLPDAVFDFRLDQMRWPMMRQALDTCPVWEAWGSLFKPSISKVHKRTGIHEGHTPGTLIHLMIIDHRLGLKTNEHAAVAFLDSRVGTRYDWRGIARFAIRRAIGDDTRLFCSEYASIAYVAYGAALLRRVEPHLISPGDLYRSPLLSVMLSIRTHGEGK